MRRLEIFGGSDRWRWKGDGGGHFGKDGRDGDGSASLVKRESRS
jgi:hypothetical protein